MKKSGDNIWQEMVLHHGDLVLQGQLALFQPRDLHLVVAACAQERVDGGVEVAVFGLQRCQSLAQFVFGHAVLFLSPDRFARTLSRAGFGTTAMALSLPC